MQQITNKEKAAKVRAAKAEKAKNELASRTSSPHRLYTSTIAMRVVEELTASPLITGPVDDLTEAKAHKTPTPAIASTLNTIDKKHPDMLAIRDLTDGPITSRAKAREAVQYLKAKRKIERTSKPPKILKSAKSKERCAMIVQTALEQFLAHGYEAVSLAGIIKESGGSLSTIYECFGSKEGLFRATIQAAINDFAIIMESNMAQYTATNLEDFLYEFALDFLMHGYNIRISKLNRIAISQTLATNNDVCAMFYATARNKIYKMLSNQLSKGPFSKQIKSNNYDILAEQFCLMISAPFAIRNIYCGENFDMSDSELKKYARQCIQLFLNGAVSKC